MNAITQLQKILDEVPAKLKIISDDIASKRPAPGKWSKKEIMGHLIDSAFNNHQRFIRMQLEKHQDLLQYKQNEWVTIQNYQSLEWKTIIALWVELNKHILHIWRNMDGSKLTNTGKFPEYGVQTLQYMVDDYIIHMEHHLGQVFLPSISN